MIYLHETRRADLGIITGIDEHVKSARDRDGMGLRDAANGTRRLLAALSSCRRFLDCGPELGFRVGAGEGNGTLITSLEDRER
jgi:hypothetical protein